MRRAFATILIFAGLACTPTRDTTSARPAPPPILRPHLPAWSAPSSWVDSTLASMSLAEKVGQVIMAPAYGHYLSTDTDEMQDVVAAVTSRHLGGIIMFQGDVYEEAIAINTLQRRARIPLLVSGDFERGLAMRVRRGTYFPDAMAIGATRNTAYAYAAGKAIAEEGRAIGVHQNYAPVADINTNPLNPVINTRAFSDDPGLVSDMVDAFVRGTNDGGMISTVKHFPGHGGTEIDSHLDLPTVTSSLAGLQQVELVPFERAIKAGALSVMVAHLAVPAIDPTQGLPASLSFPVITGLLKSTLGFRGLVVTDAMEMQGITRGFSVSDAVVRSFNAGVDLMLMPGDDDVAVTALMEAVTSGTIPASRLDDAVRKILVAKQWLGLDTARTVDLSRIPAIVGNDAHRLLARTIARDAITVLRNDGSLLPLKPFGKQRVIAFCLNDTEDNIVPVNRPGNPWPSEPAGTYFGILLRRHGIDAQVFRLSPSLTDQQSDSMISRAAGADIILLPVLVKVRTGTGTIGLPRALERFVSRLAALKKPTGVVSFGNPYLAAGFTRPGAVLCAYADAEPLTEAAVEALCGEVEVHGALPVTIGPSYPFGAGLHLPKVNLREDDPSVAGFDPAKLDETSRIITAAIRDSAFPSAQLVVMKDGIVALNKAYGTLTYDVRSRETNTSTMYDLASLTKVIATTSATMRLIDQGVLHLDDTVARFIPAFREGQKSVITIRHLLTHTSGMAPFLKLWDICTTPEQTLDTIYHAPLIAAPGDTTVYSDLGVITLGKIIEQLTGESLDAYVRRTFFIPLGMNNTMFTPPEELWPNVAPTEFDAEWRKRLVQGTVHDERSALLGGVAGHAGLFSTARDLATFMAMLLNGGTYGGTRYLQDSTVALFTRRQSPRSTRALGWDTRSEHGSSAGDLFSMHSFGHTGFTGTSVWADPERHLVVILLANRVYPTRANTKIFRVRPAVANAVVQALRGEGTSQTTFH